MTPAELFRRFVAVLMICVILFVCSPIQAQAVGLESILLYGDDLIYIFTAIFIGLGIIAPPVWYEATAEQMASDIEQELTIDPDSVLSVNFGVGFDGPSPEDPLYLKVLKRANQLGKLMVAEEVLEWCLKWLYDAAILKLESSSSYGGGVEFVYSPDLSAEAKAYWNEIDIYTSANSAKAGQMLMLSSNYSTYSTSMTAWGLQVSSLSNGIGVLFVRGNYSFNLAPYTSENFPVGSFVALNSFLENPEVTYFNTDSYCTNTIFLNYDDAVKAYNDPSVDMDYYYYLTPESYIDPYTNTAASTGWSDVYCSSICNLGSISKSGVVATSKIYVTIGTGYNSYRYVFAPSFTTGNSIVTDEPDVALGEVSDPDIPFSAGYANWYTNQVLNAGTVYLPVGTFEDYSSNSELTQEQVWTGSVYPAFPVFDKEIAPGIVYYKVGEKATPLAVNATSPDGGIITYQWYLNGSPLEGAITSTIIPSTTEVGTFTYFCYVRNVNPDNPMLFSDSGTYPVQVRVLYETGTETPPELDPNADKIQGDVSDSKTEYEDIQSGLNEIQPPNYSDLDLSFDHILGKNGIKLASEAIEAIFNNSYIWTVFFIAFTFGCISFVIFGKRE